MCGCGGVEDGHGKNVRESQKPVHYDYKNLLEEYSTMRKFSWMLLVLLVLVGCGEKDSGLDDLTAEVESLKNQIVVLKQDLKNQITGLKFSDEDGVVVLI